MVFIRFEGAKWQVDGLPRGVYPVKPVKRRWVLAIGRPNPKLHIDRWQLPLAPAFAITAHASQEQTLGSAIVDARIGSESSPVAMYVALTRVKFKETLFIYRPSPLSSFTKKALLSQDSFLKHSRQEALDWSRIAEELHRRKTIIKEMTRKRDKGLFAKRVAKVGKRKRSSEGEAAEPATKRMRRETNLDDTSTEPQRQTKRGHNQSTRTGGRPKDQLMSSKCTKSEPNICFAMWMRKVSIRRCTTCMTPKNVKKPH